MATAVTMSVGIPSCFGRNIESIKTENDFNGQLPAIKAKLNRQGREGKAKVQVGLPESFDNRAFPLLAPFQPSGAFRFGGKI